MTQEVRTRTFVAPCVGGSLDGRLLRHSIVIEHVMVPRRSFLLGVVHEVYDLVVRADGSKIWQYVER